MSFRGRGGGRGGGRGFRGGGRGRGRGGGGYYDAGPPDRVVELGALLHPCESDLVCKGTNPKVPYFNAPVYLENKSQIGKIDEIFGPMNEYLFSVKLGQGMQATSFDKGHKFFIDPYKLLPMERFVPQPRGASGRVEKPRGGRGRGGFRGGRGGGFRGRGMGGGGFRGRGGGRGSGRGRGRY